MQVTHMQVTHMQVTHMQVTHIQLRRHDWVYLRAGVLPAIGSADVAAREWLEGWIAGGGPLVVTRQSAGEETGVALGIVLPAALGSTRIACTIPSSAIARRREPVTVDEAATVLPAAEGRALLQFAAVIAGHALQLGVYGSTAWQFLTAEVYRHAHSDLDLICDVASSAGFAACLAAFADAARYFPSRIDGEVRITGGRAVAWRELHDACNGGPSVVLAKSMRDVALLSLRQILAPLR
jgi:phosphoribosyl-dephospho-CoA transferase